MENGGLAAMIYDMRNRDISDFEVRDVPSTAALAEQKIHTLDSLHRWWLAVLERDFVWKSRHGLTVFQNWADFYATELLWRSYLQWCEESRPFDRKSRVQLGKMMTDIYVAKRPSTGEKYPLYEVDMPDTGTDPIVYGERPAGYTVNDVETARIRFTEISEIVGEWGNNP